jgi:hypothetical protein
MQLTFAAVLTREVGRGTHVFELKILVLPQKRTSQYRVFFGSPRICTKFAPYCLSETIFKKVPILTRTPRLRMPILQKNVKM